MANIALLSNETIDKIAAGEVVERPLNVVKELIENSIDANATAITCEIKGGGIELIRVTDNGFGIEANDCAKAFLRHATSKITCIEDLDSLISLGFRGEALSSISAVSKTEMITKTETSLLGKRIVVEGGKLVEDSEVGAPKGTTIILRSLFYNTPARKKFLKSPTTEGAMIEDILEKFALSHPEIAFQFILNGKTKISTSGNGKLEDVIYHIFGKDIYSSLLPVEYDGLGINIKGFCAKPSFSYPARNGELYFVNGRYVRSKVINTAIEEVYKKYLMRHQFPFCVLFIEVSPSTIDINVHPQKMEVKFSDNLLIQDSVIESLNEAIGQKELIPEVSVPLPEIKVEEDITFETEVYKKDEPVEIEEKVIANTIQRGPEPFELNRFESIKREEPPVPVQETFFEKKLLSSEPLKEYKIIGQVFDTYWLISLDNDLYIVDQHAAHEKVNYEKLVNLYNSKEGNYGQMMNPPIIINLSPVEKETLDRYLYVFQKTGFEIEEFGINAVAIRTTPLELYGLKEEELFHSLLNELCEKEGAFTPEAVLAKLASMSCKAAIKGGQRISYAEMSSLMKQLMELENPYNCPHGRPVFIKITKNELEKKFKRIV